MADQIKVAFTIDETTSANMLKAFQALLGRMEATERRHSDESAKQKERRAEKVAERAATKTRRDEQRAERDRTKEADKSRRDKLRKDKEAVREIEGMARKEQAATETARRHFERRAQAAQAAARRTRPGAASNIDYIYDQMLEPLPGGGGRGGGGLSGGAPGARGRRGAGGARARPGFLDRFGLGIAGAVLSGAALKKITGVGWGELGRAHAEFTLTRDVLAESIGPYSGKEMVAHMKGPGASTARLGVTPAEHMQLMAQGGRAAGRGAMMPIDLTLARMGTGMRTGEVAAGGTMMRQLGVPAQRTFQEFGRAMTLAKRAGLGDGRWAQALEPMGAIADNLLRLGTKGDLVGEMVKVGSIGAQRGFTGAAGISRGLGIQQRMRQAALAGDPMTLLWHGAAERGGLAAMFAAGSGRAEETTAALSRAAGSGPTSIMSYVMQALQDGTATGGALRELFGKPTKSASAGPANLARMGRAAMSRIPTKFSPARRGRIARTRVLSAEKWIDWPDEFTERFAQGIAKNMSDWLTEIFGFSPSALPQRSQQEPLKGDRDPDSLVSKTAQNIAVLKEAHKSLRVSLGQAPNETKKQIRERLHAEGVRGTTNLIAQTEAQYVEQQARRKEITGQMAQVDMGLTATRTIHDWAQKAKAKGLVAIPEELGAAADTMIDITNEVGPGGLGTSQIEASKELTKAINKLRIVLEKNPPRRRSGDE